MKIHRSAGVLCHISELPGDYGVGSLGKRAYDFARLLARSGVKYWQILPLVQTGFGDSPYQSVACNSGNPYFIDLELLCKEKLLTREELKAAVRKPDSVDFGDLYQSRYPLLRKAFSRFAFDNETFRTFVKQGKFEDYALFMTAKSVFGGTFSDWEEGLRFRDPAAIEALRTEYHEEYLFWQFLQYEFWKQWEALHAYCRKLGLMIVGDIPLYVAYDSADVWAHPDLFKLDEELKPAKVSGVPPDYFSEKGQLWGNPVYDWGANEASGFAWWTERLRTALTTYDVVRIDHFRGIDRYYEIDAAAEDATAGTWQKGPGEALFSLLGEGRDHIIAEDLGLIDEGVRALLKRTGFPGMKVLLFAFDGNENNDYLPKNIGENSIVYTGTHDNDTVRGYVDRLTAEEYILLRSRVAAALETENIEMNIGAQGEGMCEAFVRLALSCKASLAIIPVHDLLGLGEEARMNTPGTDRNNWQFRLKKQPSARAMGRLKKMIKIYRR